MNANNIELSNTDLQLLELHDKKYHRVKIEKEVAIIDFIEKDLEKVLNLINDTAFIELNISATLPVIRVQKMLKQTLNKNEDELIKLIKKYYFEYETLPNVIREYKSNVYDYKQYYIGKITTLMEIKVE